MGLFAIMWSPGVFLAFADHELLNLSTAVMVPSINAMFGIMDIPLGV